MTGIDVEQQGAAALELFMVVIIESGVLDPSSRFVGFCK
jgi:hypothetical protein